MSGEKIEIPRNVAIAVSGAHRVLRECMRLTVTTHESWVCVDHSQQEECGTPGACGDHGTSEEYKQYILAEHGPGPWHDYDRTQPLPCTAFVTHRYAYVGEAKIKGRPVKLHMLFYEIHNDAMGVLSTMHVWVQQPGMTLQGVYGIGFDGTPFSDSEECDPLPPADIFGLTRHTRMAH